MCALYNRIFGGNWLRLISNTRTVYSAASNFCVLPVCSPIVECSRFLDWGLLCVDVPHLHALWRANRFTSKSVTLSKALRHQHFNSRTQWTIRRKELYFRIRLLIFAVFHLLQATICLYLQVGDFRAYSGWDNCICIDRLLFALEGIPVTKSSKVLNRTGFVWCEPSMAIIIKLYYHIKVQKFIERPDPELPVLLVTKDTSATCW